MAFVIPENEVARIKKTIKSYPGYEKIAASLGKLLPQNIVAGLIGCIIPESGTNRTILNKKEYQGRGVSGTEGWNCGEGLIQWTYWKYKLPLIKKYNADSRSTQKLPTSWDQYKRGTPIEKGKNLFGKQDGIHISGLNLDNQMLFLTLYYSDVIKKLTKDPNNPPNLETIVAKIYQHKAGNGFYKNISDPVERAYITAQNKYYSSAGNHYLQSLKIAREYLGVPVDPATVDTNAVDYSVSLPSELGSSESAEPIVTTGTISNMNKSKRKKTTRGHILGYHMRQK